MLDELFLLNGVLNIGDWIPWLDFLDLQGYVKRMKELKARFDRFHDHVIDEHNAKRKSTKNWQPKDMVDLLLQLADDPDLEVKLTKDNIKDLIAGGTDTAATMGDWSMSELLKKPQLFTKMILVSLANMLHGFTWELPPGMKPQDVKRDEVFGLATQRKYPLVAVAKPRLPLHLYN
ncbi:FLAVONOID 3'-MONOOXYGENASE-LIKE [Salix purpurea]|uniref:FLAVONOID 3'-MONOOXYGENASE-LIKE n=1 Tax=Salix purpurea TaxID=77065 RepID=A0A9Q0T3D3_SALPP|nr:FLAVONOID 3'-MONOOXYGENASE-LIKE [Salix purpurea]